ncbi:hydroxymethylglutaryl-CoA lyase [Sporothrix brasiliensis 5110]|uniref:hydroxymethylglutaryl-CoA lyase n=1 Tax=Sporothrix brasiliensis 5110 TaxID=1398154 RepID=A0A0C2FI65_9PEZI|nr:hydroxymethylglutaryl-CoA lyase [Sporothrix brasiliensis 5110]KIH90753.1 hydroxymethylglutaryl-CoA lyase [Sporothrix brasiliensis 5110]
MRLSTQSLARAAALQSCKRASSAAPFSRAACTGVRRFATAQSTASEAQAAAAAAAASDNHVHIVEVGPRDGLQNEKRAIPLATKIELLERLAKTGLRTIEAGSFVAPKWVPQMNNSAEILEHILQHRLSSPVPISYAFLVPNTKGLANATAILQQHTDRYVADVAQAEAHAEAASSRSREATAGAETKPSSFLPAVELAVFAAATESFSQKNLNCDIATSLDRFREVIRAAKQTTADAAAASGTPVPLRVRAYISTVLGCPFEGPDTDPRRVAEIATDFLEMGADEIALGDTTGMGTAPRTKDLLRSITAAGIRNEDVALHFHDTYGQALVNTAVGLEHGIRTFDSSVGGLGGCPYSPGATGNVATENMVYFLESLGMDTGVDLDAVADIGAWITGEIGKANDSSVGKAVLGARLRNA